MAVLPTPYTDRVVPSANRPVAGVSGDAMAAPGRAVARLGNVIQDTALFVQDREDTAAAKERDAYVSDEIRKILHDPETGFSNMYGRNAVAARSTALDRLKSLQESAQKDLSNGAKRKLDTSLTKRIDSAMQSIDTHTGTERNRWLDGASAARIEAAEQDALATGSVADSFAIISGELTQKADREGWDAARLDLELGKAKSSLVYNQAILLADKNPEFALDFVNSNADSLRPGDALKLKATLEPLAKAHKGRNIGRAAFGSLGDMSAALTVARDTLGMNETDRSAALKEYLADGGVNLDPAQIAWCAAYVNATLAQSGMSGTGSNMARSFLNWGVEVDQPNKGDLVVLSRGADPAKGHVGFFDGYDEAGNIRILGGNQNNEVSVATYNANRVLGFRRAKPVVAMPDDAGSKIAEIMQIDDPVVRKAALDEFNTFYSVAEGQRKAQLTAATDAAFRHIEAGNDPANLPLDIRQSLGMDGMSSLRTYYGKMQSGVAIETDSNVYVELRQMQATDPQGFANVNMLDYVNDLSKADFKSFVDDQAKGVSPDSGNAAATLMTVAKRQMEASGIDTTPKPGKAESAQVAAMQTRLLKWQDKFIKDTGREPTQLEIDERVGRELVSVTLDAPWSFAKSGHVFDAPDVDPEKLAKTGITIGDVEIPPAVVEEQIAAMEADGVPITSDALVQRLAELMEGF